MTDEYIRNKIINSTGKLKSNIVKFLSNEEIEYINNRFEDSDSFKESAVRICYNIIDKPKCTICGKPVQYIKSNKFRDTCSNRKCIVENAHNHRVATCRIKYGCDYTTQSKEMKDKSKATKQDRYGNCYWSNPQKTKDTWNNKTKEELEIIHNKTVDTCMKKYGVPNGGGSDIAIEKIKNSMLVHYGVESIFMSKEEREKWKKICLDKYGKEYYQSTDEFKDRIKANKEASIKKRKETLKNTYGDETYNNQEQRIKTITKKYGSPNYYNVDKRNETMKANNSYGKSKEEDKLYELLKKIYPDILRQYTSDKYPFVCDFYIPSKDLYIEYQGSQYHRNRAFTDSEQDMIELKELKYKAEHSNRHKENKKSQYDNMIYVWTDLDVRKRNIAKENNLNYIEIWNIDEYKNII
ncbi:MAG: hypothetical protein J6D03_01215 [Clostridia bacterium]|nr:hypothetical protein [Clostridia bacterium]